MGLKKLSRHTGLTSLHRDLALVCEAAQATSDAPSVLPNCDAALIDRDGALHALGRNHLLAAQRLPADRMLFLTRDLSLIIRETSGVEHIIASSAAEPRVSEDGSRVVFTQFHGATELQPGNIGKLVSRNMSDGVLHTVTEDPSASSPFPVPGSQDVIFLSARTGLASIWMAAPGLPDRQITNIGKTRVDGNFVPVFGRELVWIPGTRKAVYTASYGTHNLWLLDIDKGRAVKLGPGRLPQWAENAAIMAIDDDPGSPGGAVQYPYGGMR